MARAVPVFMGTGFEQLLVWRRARSFCGAILPVLRAARAAHDYELVQELNAAGISIMSNIAEGHLRRWRRQFAYFLNIAAGSLGEARSCLYLALDRGYASQTVFQSLCDETNEMGRMLEALQASVEEQSNLPPPARQPKILSNLSNLSNL